MTSWVLVLAPRKMAGLQQQLSVGGRKEMDHQTIEEVMKELFSVSYGKLKQRD